MDTDTCAFGYSEVCTGIGYPQVDPYMQSIYDETVMVIACEECVYRRAEDI